MGTNPAADELRRRCGRWGAWLTPFGRLPFADLAGAAAGFEAGGATSLWTGEEFAREILATSALLLSHTSRATVATGVASIWARDPVTMMNGARTLEEAYPGRFALTVGVSHGPRVAERGHQFSASVDGFAEYLGRMRSAPYAGASVGDPPVLMGALGPRMLRLAAEATAGSFAWLVPRGYTSKMRAEMGDRAFLAVGQAVVVAPDRETARERAGGLLEKYLSLPNYRAHFRRAGFPDETLVAPLGDALFDALVAWGEPEEVLGKVRRHLHDGADHIVLYPLDRANAVQTVATLVRLDQAGTDS